MKRPELTVIVPTLNEAAVLPALLGDLACQRDVMFEVIVSDGGSRDDTATVAEQALAALGVAGRVIVSPRGRAAQLNRGAAESVADWLLFLHADSRLPYSDALRTALDLLQQPASSGPRPVAAHFALRFDLDDGQRSFGYYFYEAKARLDRPGCTHGDQGFVLSRDCFSRIGPFDEDLPLFEDTRFAERIRSNGEWLLVPKEIVTSARRFVAEGLCERQVLNALVMNFAAIGWTGVLHAIPQFYRAQNRAKKIDLLAFWRLIRRELSALSVQQRFHLWAGTGAYVLNNVWQLAFMIDCASNRRQGLLPGEGPTRSLDFYDKWLGAALAHPPGRALATVLTWTWFQFAHVWLLLVRRGQRIDDPEGRGGEDE